MLQKLNIIAVILICVAWVVASCGSSSRLPDGGLGDSRNHIVTGTEDDPFVTELIAGAGQGWPGTGLDVGRVELWHDATELHVTYFLDVGGWYFAVSPLDEGGEPMDENLHLYVGTTPPAPPVAPGQFPFKAYANPALGEYKFVLDLVGEYPKHGNEDPVPYDWTGLADSLYVAAHADVCEVAGGAGFPSQGVFKTMGLYYGSKDIPVGYVTLAIVGGSVVVTIYADSPWVLTETQLYLGLVPPPKFAPGLWPWKHEPLPAGTTVDSYTVPLEDIPAEPGDLVYIAVHAALYNTATGTAVESATAWNPGCRVRFLKENGEPHWKSYCKFIVPEGNGEPGEERCETAWGLDPVLGYDGVPANEPGWFPAFYEGLVSKWGWVFRYLVD